MTHLKLTARLAPANFLAKAGRGKGTMRTVRPIRAGMVMAGTMVLCGALGGCINVAAPNEPIVIELNINIKQEVIYRLAEDAANTVEDNEDIF